MKEISSFAVYTINEKMPVRMDAKVIYGAFHQGLCLSVFHLRLTTGKYSDITIQGNIIIRIMRQCEMHTQSNCKDFLDVSHSCIYMQ